MKGNGRPVKTYHVSHVGIHDLAPTHSQHAKVTYHATTVAPALWAVTELLLVQCVDLVSRSQTLYFKKQKGKGRVKLAWQISSGLIGFLRAKYDTNRLFPIVVYTDLKNPI